MYGDAPGTKALAAELQDTWELPQVNQDAGIKSPNSGSSLAGTLRGPPTQGQVPKEPSAALAIKLLLIRFEVHVQGCSGEALQESPPQPQNVPHSPRAPRLTHDLWLTC